MQDNTQAAALLEAECMRAATNNLSYMGRILTRKAATDKALVSGVPPQRKSERNSLLASSNRTAVYARTLQQQRKRFYILIRTMQRCCYVAYDGGT